MKKTWIVKIWFVVLIAIILCALPIAQNNFDNDPSTLFSGPAYAIYIFLYVGAYLYLTALIAIIVSIVKSSKIVDTGEKIRQIIAKSALLIFLLFFLPTIYHLIF